MTKPIALPCPCNGKLPVAALSKDKTKYVIACPSCSAMTVPCKTQLLALKVWNAGVSESKVAVISH